MLRLDAFISSIGALTRLEKHFENFLFTKLARQEVFYLLVCLHERNLLELFKSQSRNVQSGYWVL